MGVFRDSFGFDGANAHVIVESPVSEVAAIAPRSSSGHCGVIMPLIVSGKPESALKAAADSAHFLRSTPEVNLFDLTSSAALRRDWHEHWAIAFGATYKSFSAALEGFACGDANGGDGQRQHAGAAFANLRLPGEPIRHQTRRAHPRIRGGDRAAGPRE